MKTGIKIYLGSFLLVFSLFFTACNHQTDIFDGPSLNDRFGPFVLNDSLEVSQATVDFSVGERVSFTSSFSKRISWVVRITGEESGAVKLIEGFDNELNVDNATWLGNTTELPFFREEVCKVELIIPEEDSLTLTKSVEITGSRVYEGTLLTDFEENLGSRLSIPSFVFQFSPETGVRSDLPAGQGENFFFLEGTAVPSVDPFFAGLIRITPPGGGQDYFEMPSTVPENTYFNIFIYGDGTPHTIAVINLFTDTNDNGVLNEGPDRAFSLGDINVDFEGWRLFSFTLEELGMTQEEAGKLVGFQAALISNNNTQPNPPLPVRYGIDNIVFTVGQPLQI